MKLNKTDIFMLVVGGIILLGVHAFFFSPAFFGKILNAENASQYGSFIGGYIGTIVSIFAALLLYLTLRNQRRSSKLEKFENKFFDMIKLHRENAAEATIRDESGRKVFVTMLSEFREIFKAMKMKNNEALQIEEKDLLNVSYLIFFYGGRSKFIKNFE